MSHIVGEVGTNIYFKELLKSKIALPTSLVLLGPTLLLQILFKLVNERPDEMQQRRYIVGCEMFKNLAHMENLQNLDLIDLGIVGQSFYGKLSGVALDVRASWQAYAAAVYFRTQSTWVENMLQGDHLRGELKPALTSSRRNIQDKENFKQAFAIGITARYPRLDSESIRLIMTQPKMMLTNEFLCSIEATHFNLRNSLIKFIADVLTPVHDMADIFQFLHAH